MKKIETTKTNSNDVVVVENKENLNKESQNGHFLTGKFSKDGEIFKVENAKILTENHETIEVENGNYVAVIQQCVDPISRIKKNVVD